LIVFGDIVKRINNKTIISALAGASSLLLIPLGARAVELPPQDVVYEIYAGMQFIHDYQETPDLIVVEPGYGTACGPVSGSGYCSLEHTIFITYDDGDIAYEYGDAALAYIIAHEYAHAMQTAFGFEPSVAPISEIQADCLAGAYLAEIPNLMFDEKDLEEIGSFAYDVGDFYYWSEQHHGTPEQRVQAVAIGFVSGLEGKGFSVCVDSADSYELEDWSYYPLKAQSIDFPNRETKSKE
jgi:uncharacterized protein